MSAPRQDRNRISQLVVSSAPRQGGNIILQLVVWSAPRQGGGYDITISCTRVRLDKGRNVISQIGSTTSYDNINKMRRFKRIEWTN